jgi:hypothetical protein
LDVAPHSILSFLRPKGIRRPLQVWARMLPPRMEIIGDVLKLFWETVCIYHDIC